MLPGDTHRDQGRCDNDDGFRVRSTHPTTAATAAMNQPPATQIPGVYHRRIGDMVVTALSDGTLERTTEMMRDVTPPEAQALLDDAFRPKIVVSVNAFLIRTAGRVALIETGSGQYLGPTAGRLPANLAAAGVGRGDITAILLTHMHPDHSAGLTDLT